jgi:HPt (histidine-containing phosphotransfer) domain-containing protein
MSKEETKIDAMLTTLWDRNLPLLRERLDTLDRTAAAAASDHLPEVLRSEALDIAHKLSGSLGMFGRHRGTEIAREMEAILRAPIPAAMGRLSSLSAALRNDLFPGG